MRNWSRVLGLIALTCGTFLLIIAFLPPLFETTYSIPASSAEALGSTYTVVEKPKVTHIKTPEPLKALYMTACVAGTPSWRARLKHLIDTTELNAIVIDIKDFTGAVSFPRDESMHLSSSTTGGCVVSDMKEFINELHASGIYVIGRISVFQDVLYVKHFPELAVRKKSDGGIWKDHKGLTFVDVGAKNYWDYIVELANDAHEIGFDEINFDYVRYPSDGDMSNVKYVWTEASSTKPDMLENFFRYLHGNLKETGVKTSVDLFGMTMTVETDMGIGQVFERALPYFDYVAPMVYPSHYPKKWNGFANPAEYPYEVIKIVMTNGVERERAFNIARGDFWIDDAGATTTPPSKLRPWLQDFNLGATYGPDKIKAQIQATYDSSLTSWMLWSAANKYTESALVEER